MKRLRLPAGTCPGSTLLLCLGLLVAAITGCRADPCRDTADPLAGLLCATPSPVFDEAYWRHEAEGGGSAWQRGFAFCREHAFPPDTRCALLARIGQGLDARREAEAARRSLEQALEQRSGPGGFTGLPPARDPAPSPASPSSAPPPAGSPGPS